MYGVNGGTLPRVLNLPDLPIFLSRYKRKPRVPAVTITGDTRSELISRYEREREREREVFVFKDGINLYVYE